MRLDWIMNPLALYGALAAAMIAFLVTWLGVEARIRVLRQTAMQSGLALAQQFEEMGAAMEGLRENVAEIGSRPAPADTRLNPARRALALRMRRRGASAATVAAALGVPQNELDLLWKLQKVVE
jgi:hypothetical protein